MKTKRRARSRTAALRHAPWWGDGKAPHLEWPGSTIEIACVWSAKRSRWESPDGRYYFDMAAADRAEAFFPTLLVHHIGEFAGLPFELLAYQKKCLTRPLFGWKRTSDDRRRFRKVFAFLPKGAGKSPWASGTGLYLMLCDAEPAAEVYAVAADKNQARVVHENAKIMVEQAPDLGEVCEVLRDSIQHASSRSTYQVLSSDAATKHGMRPHAVIFDEFHAQPNRNLYEALKKSMPKRRQPVMLLVSHAGHDDEGICYEEYEYAKGVLKGSIPDDTCLPVIFEADKDDDWTDPAVWRRVNPGHGITVKTDGIATECEEAKAEPRKLNDFLMYHLNRWVNQASAWIPVDWWDACTEAMPSDAELRELPCAFGIDMAQKIDLAAGVAVFRLPLARRSHDAPATIEVQTETETGALVKRELDLDYRIAILPQFWLPEDTIRERARNDGIRYDTYADDGLLIPVEGAIITSEPIVRYLVGRGGTAGLLARFPNLKEAEFGFDPAFATEVAVRLRDGHELKVVEVLQNYKYLSEACQVFEALVKAKRVIHGGHRLLRWNLENVAIKTDDAGRIRPVKPKKATKRIDGIVAAIIALSRLIALGDDGVSDASRDFEERGLYT